MYKPDYTRSIVNLMASVAHGLGGGDTGYAPLAELPAERLRGRPVVLLLIDGMGAALLRRYPDSHLARAQIGQLTSVFPTTTASAITSLATGVAPQQHAITGWYMWLRELGSVATILPFMPRHGGAPYSMSGWSPAQFIGSPPLADRVSGPVTVLSPDWMNDSAYNQVSVGRAQRLSFSTVEQYFAQVAGQLRDGRPQYLYAYWAELDNLSHHYGCNSPQVHEHFQVLDRAFAALCAELRGTGALVMVTADHGFTDTSAEHTLQLADHPALSATLALPLCGEPRTAYCYVRPGKVQEFLAYANSELSTVCEAVESAQLISEGWFGLGTPHPRLHERVGDYVLMMKQNYVLRDRLANEKAYLQVGVHGGTSQAEMEVPLIYREVDAA